MSAPVFLSESLDGVDAGQTMELAGAEGHHAVTVMRLRSGDAIEVVDGRGTRVVGTVADLGKGMLNIAVARVLHEAIPHPQVIVVQALAKGDRGERAVETLTEVGVDVIVPWAAQHSVSVWKGEKSERGADKWRTTARTAAKQARRAYVPVVREVVGIDELCEMASGATLALVLDEHAAQSLASFPVPDDGDIVLIVGPEGGIAERERDLLTEAGAHLARLGPTVLRTSTAGTVAAAVLLSGTHRWHDLS